MNISHKQLQNSSISQQKKQFYEKLKIKFNRAWTEYRKKHTNFTENYNKKIYNWLFSQDEETRMILCCVENKKYTNILSEAYSYYLKDSNTKFRIIEENSENENLKLEKEDSYFDRENSFHKIPNPKNNAFLQKIYFYQCESPIEDTDNYSSYFTLDPSILRSEEIFKDYTNELTSYKFLTIPIKTKKENEVQNKTNVSFEFPDWIISTPNSGINNNNDINGNFSSSMKNDNNNIHGNNIYGNNECNYFPLSHYFLALIEQVLSIRYILFHESKDMDEIKNSTYLYELFEKKKQMINFLNNSLKPNKNFFSTFKLEDVVKKLYSDRKIDNFIYSIGRNCAPYENRRGWFTANSLFFDRTKILNSVIFEVNNVFDNIQFDGGSVVFIIDTLLFFNISKLFTYDDFLLRCIFERIYQEYSEKIYEDLITGGGEKDESTHKKKKKKKKKAGNKNNVEEKNLDIDDNKEIGRFIFEILITKVFKEIEIMNLNSNKEINSNNVIICENENNINNKKSKNKEKGFFIYETIKKNDTNKKNKNKNKKKQNGNIKNNKVNNINTNEDNNITSNKKDENNIKTKQEDIKKEINMNNNVINQNEKENNNISKENKDKINILIEKDYQKSPQNETVNIEENNINHNAKNTNNNLKKKPQQNSPISNKESIPSHINSFTFSSSNNSSTSVDSNNNKQSKSDKISFFSNFSNNNINSFDSAENNLVVMHYNQVLFPFEKLNKLSIDIKNFNENLESLLSIKRKIKIEIKYHFEYIVRKIYNSNSRVEMYGSTLYKLDIESSDLDLSISTNSNLSLASLVIYLSNNNKNKQYKNINAILGATVPIVKLDVDFLKLDNDKINYYYQLLVGNNYYNKFDEKNEEKENNIIKVDLSMNSVNHKQIYFIKTGIKSYPEIRPIIKILKKVLQVKNMNNCYKGGMSSYCLFLLIYSYVKLYYTMNARNSNKKEFYDFSCGSLLIGLLFYYVMVIDFKCTIINPRFQNPFIVSYKLESIPTIIDPNTMKNAGHNIFKILDVINIFRDIYKDLFFANKIEGSENLIYKLIEKYEKNGIKENQDNEENILNQEDKKID